MVRGKLEHHRPLTCLAEQVNAHNILQHPPCRRSLNPFACLVGKGRRMVFERLAYALFQGRIH